MRPARRSGSWAWRTRLPSGEVGLLCLEFDNSGGWTLTRQFEGEADPSTMQLQMKTWTWQRTLFNNDATEKLLFAARFTGANFSPVNSPDASYAHIDLTFYLQT